MNSQSALGEILQTSIRKVGYDKIKDAADKFNLPYETLRKTISENHIPRDPTLLDYARFFNIDPAMIIRLAQQSRFERKTGTRLETLGDINEDVPDKAHFEAMLAAADSETFVSVIESFFNVSIRNSEIEKKIREYDENKPTRGKIMKWKKESKEPPTKNIRSALLCFFEALTLPKEDQKCIVRMIRNMQK